MEMTDLKDKEIIEYMNTLKTSKEKSESQFSDKEPQSYITHIMDRGIM